MSSKSRKRSTPAIPLLAWTRLNASLKFSGSGISSIKLSAFAVSGRFLNGGLENGRGLKQQPRTSRNLCELVKSVAWEKTRSLFA